MSEVWNFFQLKEDHVGKLLGYMISKDGIIINLERAKTITSIAYSNNKKSMQSFLG